MTRRVVASRPVSYSCGCVAASSRNASRGRPAGNQWSNAAANSPASSNQRAAAGVLRGQLVVRSSGQLGQEGRPHERVHAEPTVDADAGDEQATRVGAAQELAGVRPAGQRLGEAGR